jgi:hypothetical protein
MDIDLTLPATGLTKDGDLYQVLRNNFNAIYNRYTLIEYTPTILAGWRTNNQVKYWKDAFGFAYICGDISIDPALGSPSSTCFLLPGGFRPETVQYFPGLCYKTNTWYDITINLTGAVMAGSVDSDITVSFNGISFRAV